MKKSLIAITLAAAVVGCGSGEGDTKSSSATGTRTKMGGTVNEPSGSMNPKPTPGSNTMGTGRPHSYESTNTGETKNR
jgi:hypothetical protein